MGLLRLILALSVVIIHAYPIFGHQFISSNIAVNSFFIISGFYMAFILHEKYIGKNGSYKTFIINRFLRIYPLYWVIILVLFGLAAAEMLLAPSDDNALKIMLRVASESSNPLFTGVMMILRNLTLILTTDYFQTNFHTPGYLLLLAAWTLQIELLFYLMAPFITRLQTGVIIAFAVLFAWLTFANPFPVLRSDISVTTIFLSKFVFFLLGIISYDLYKKFKGTAFLKRYAKPVVIIFFIVTCIFGYFSTNPDFTEQDKNNFIFYFLLVMVTIPFLFHISAKNKIDRSLAYLSYPVYLSHIVIIKAISTSPVRHLDQTFLTFLIILLTLIISWILVITIEKPIDRLRKKMLE